MDVPYILGALMKKTLVISHSGWFDYKYDLIFSLSRESFNLILWTAWWKDQGILSQDVLFNLLKTKRRPLYLKNQSVPRSKHFSSRL